MISLIGILFLLFLLLNLSFSQSFIVRRVNGVLSGSGVPVHIGSITTILPRTVEVNDISIVSPEGDTLIYAGEVASRFHPLGLLRRKVMLENVRLERVGVIISRNESTQLLNIEEVFSPGSPEEKVKEESEPKSWEIYVKGADLSRIAFNMPDSLMGLCISQEVESLYLSNFYLSTGGQEILFGDLNLRSADGTLLLDPPVKSDNDTPEEPWRLGFSSVAMQDIHYNFNHKPDSLMLDINIGEGLVSSNKMDIEQKVIDLKRIMLAGSKVILFSGKTSVEKENKATGDGIYFPWQIGAGEIELADMEIIPCSCYFSEYSDPPVDRRISALDIDLADLHIDQSVATADLRNMDFKLENGFELKRLIGKLESDKNSIQLKLALESGNSRIEAEAMAAGSLLDLVSSAGAVNQARIIVRNTEFSPADLVYFIPETEQANILHESVPGSFLINVDLDLKDETLNISNITISQKDHVDLSVTGQAKNPFHPARSVLDLQLGIAELDSIWLNGLLTVLGVEKPVGIPGALVMESKFTGQSLSPDFQVYLRSNLGNLDLDGSVDFKGESYNLHFLLENLQPGKIFSMEEPACVYGKGEISGKGFKMDELEAELSFEADTVTINNYNYTGISLTAGWLDNILDLDLYADDPSLTGNIEVSLQFKDSELNIHANSHIFAQLDRLNLYKDSLSMQGDFIADLISRPEILSGDFHISDMALATADQQVLTGPVEMSFLIDTVSSVLTGHAGFFKADVRIDRKINQLDTLIQDYRHYLTALTRPDSVSALQRVSLLPEMYVNMHLSDNDVLRIFIPDSILEFSECDFLLVNRIPDQRISYKLSARGLGNNAVQTGQMEALIADSAGILTLQVSADDNALYDSPVNRFRLFGRVANREGITEVKVIDVNNELVYHAELAVKMDSSRIIMEVPSKKLTLNYEQWIMDSTGLMTIDLPGWGVSPNLRMHTADASVDLLTIYEEGSRQLQCNLQNVSLSSLLMSGIIHGKAGGDITGSISYGMYDEKGQRITSDIRIRDLAWSDLKFNNIEMNGFLESDEPESFAMKISTIMDSAHFEMEGEKPANGFRSFHSSFSAVPIQILEYFTGDYLSDLRGEVSGDFSIQPLQNEETFTGSVRITDAGMRVNLLNTAYSIPGDTVQFTGMKMLFDQFRILDSLNNRLVVNGSVNFGERISADLNVSSSRLQVMNNIDQVHEPFTGNIFVDSRLSIRGPVKDPEIKGRITLSEGTEIFYRHQEDLNLSESEKVVTFVNLEADEQEDLTPAVQRLRTVSRASMETIIAIDPSTRIHFNLAKKVFNINLMVQGGGVLNYQMLSNNVMSLSGKYDISEGTADLKFVGWPNKSFRITPGGFVRWIGQVDNPELKFEAQNRIRTSYINPVDSKRRDVDFNVVIKLSNQLSDLDVLFTINTPDQYLMSIINTLSPEEQMRQAITVLLFEYVDLPGISGSFDYVTEQVNQIVASQLNQLTKASIKGVDISFGLDTYTSATASGGEETKTSLSYDVRKDLFDNRAELEVSGRLDELNKQPGMSDLSLTNISLEYRLDSAGTKYLKVYNQHTYEDVFDGEVVSTGIGIKFRKRYRYLHDIWRRKEKEPKSGGTE